jgi:predicted metal-dependent hydrolase
MKAQRRGVDFSGGRRGAVLQPAAGKTRITIRLDTELLDWFREEVNRAGGGNYQTLINDSLRQHVEGKRENLEDTLRRVLREELARPRGPRG